MMPFTANLHILHIACKIFAIILYCWLQYRCGYY